MKVQFASRWVTLCWGFLFVSAVWAQSKPTLKPASDETKPSSPATKPKEIRKKIPDYCHGPVDPYIPSAERSAFFTAAGKDNELSAKEFTADQKRTGRRFVRKFDSFEQMLQYDRNHNKTLDWFEADIYRKSLRKRTLHQFDKNDDKKLTGTERDAANALFHTGKLPAKRRSFMSRLFRKKTADEELRERFDADGDGKLSEDELAAARKAMRNEHRQKILQRFDKDGDGKLSDKERAAMRAENQGPWKQMRERWAIQHFDEDGDGKIDDAEKKEIRKFGQKMAAMGREFYLRSADFDGDGKVSNEEKQMLQKEWMVVGLRMMINGRKLLDVDGDGQVSPTEMKVFQAKAAQNMQSWMEGFQKPFDANNDGRLEAAERDKLVVGIRNEFDRRYRKHDANNDGRVSAFEMEQLLTEFGRDLQLIPKDSETKTPKTTKK